MHQDPGPLVRRRQLGAILRSLRESAGFSSKEAADRLLSSPAKISRIETAQRNATLRDVRDLCDLYGVQDDALRQQLMDLARGSRQRGWWQGAGLSPALEGLIGMEGSAAAITELQLVAIPGLLQTREYAAAILDIFGSHSDEDRETAVGVRMKRQAILQSDSPPQLNVILDEAALWRRVGDSVTMHEQLMHLTTMASLSFVDLRVMPFAAGAHQGMTGGFTILDFARPGPLGADLAMSTVVYAESYSGGTFIDQPTAVEPYQIAFAETRARALSARASLELVRSAARRL